MLEKFVLKDTGYGSDTACAAAARLQARKLIHNIRPTSSWT